MKSPFRFIFSLIIFLIPTSALAQEIIYSGAYFEIKYPTNFNAIMITTDEASFTSPDKKVEFFVYSPLWSGKPQSYLDVSNAETLTSQNSQKTINNKAFQDHIQIQWVTITAKNGSYIRSYMHKRACHGNAFQDCLSLVFGIKYKNKQAYNQYRPVYLAFKKSLQQFAD